MKSFRLTSNVAFYIFIFITAVLISQTIWWYVFIEKLNSEKLELASQLGANSDILADLSVESSSRKIMFLSEAIFFLVLILLGAWLIYRTLLKIKKLNQNQQNFTLTVTHELKTPLSSIKLYLDSLLSDEISEDKKKEIIPHAKENVEKLQKLIDNILNIGKMDRADFKFNLTRINLSDLLIDRLNIFEKLSHQRSVIIKREISNRYFVEGDSKALEFVIDSILDNALKYNNSSNIELDVNLTKQENKILLQITDNGIGIEKNEVKDIFDRFYRVGSELTRESHGTGIGLFISKEIIKVHRGSIAAKSDGLGKGATLTITLEDYDSK